MTRVIIGEGKRPVSHAKCFDLGGGDRYISESSVSYFCPFLFLGIDLYIFKNTPEGKEVAKWIQSFNYHGARLWLIEVFIANCQPHLLYEAIQDALKQARNDGLEQRSQELKVLLGL